MERAKVLGILLSVLLFSAAVVAVGVFWLSPERLPDKIANSLEAPSPNTADIEFDPIERIRQLTLPGMEESDSGTNVDADTTATTIGDEYFTASPGEGTLVIGQLQEPDADKPTVPALKIVAEDSPLAMLDTGSGEIVQDPQAGLSKSSTQSQTKKPSSDQPLSTSEDSGNVTVPTVTSQDMEPTNVPVATTKTRQLSAQTVRGATTGTTATNPATVANRVTATTYWIQVASFNSVDHASLSRDGLRERGLTSIITTNSVSGRVHFRVRVGPYLSRNEAEKFLGWLKALPEYSQSYISLVRGT